MLKTEYLAVKTFILLANERGNKMTEVKKMELNAIVIDKLTQAIKAKITRTCVGYEGIKKADVFCDYLNSLNRDETMFLLNTVKALGWDAFINCINDSLEEV